MDITWESIAGHDREIRRLRRMADENRLPHALLFAGPDGIGKKRAGRVLAAMILCQGHAPHPCGTCASCQALTHGSHPDYYELVPEAQGKGTPMIRIEAVRAMQQAVSRYPVMSNGRVVLIDDADRMNEAAANSLLKTLEEPPGAVTFILVTSAPSSLLATIRSRCLTVTFGMIPPETMRQALVRRGLPEPDAEELSLLADGSMGRAISLYEEGGLDLRDEALTLLEHLPQIRMTEIWQEAETKGKWERPKIGEWVLYLNMLLRDMLLLYVDGGSRLLYHSDRRKRLLTLLDAYPEDRIFAMLSCVRDLQKRLQSNASPALQLEGFFIRMRDLCADQIDGFRKR